MANSLGFLNVRAVAEEVANRQRKVHNRNTNLSYRLDVAFFLTRRVTLLPRFARF